jgi:CheY-like chemotaxis protein
VRVLVVDDSAAVRDRLVAMLRETERIARVEEATSADEALESVRARSHDAIILDLQMPGKIGLAILHELKRGPLPPLVIVLTNDASEHHRRECFARGADFFFDKSKHFDRVVDVVLDPEGARAKYPSGSRLAFVAR